MTGRGALVPKNRDAEVRRVAAELDTLLARLEQNVDALTAILVRPERPQGPEDERLIPT
jgi:hypothetical protein